MNLKTWLAERFLGNEIDRRVGVRVEALREASGRQKEDEGWRRLTDGRRDLSPVTADRMREVSVYLYTHNPIARRMVNVLVEWVVGEGITFTSSHPRTQALLDRFWADPVNRWELRMESKVRELFLFGEQHWPAFANQFSGIYRLGVLDPGRVKEVLVDPDNALVPIGVVTKADRSGEERRFRTILRGDELDILSPAAQRERERFTDAQIFTFAVGNLSGMTRGISELFALADWLDGYEQLLFSLLNQERSRGNVLWDVELQGADDAAIQEFLKTAQPPKPFSIRVHNEKVKWALQGPESGAAANNDTVARLFRNHVLGGGGIPEHWYGGGGDVNRATASEMSGPAEKSFTAKQKTVKYILEEVLGCQVERGIEVGALPDDEEARDVTVNMPDLSTRDLSRVGTAVQQFASALGLGKQEGWVSDEVAVKVMATLIGQVGLEVDPEEMLERAQEQSATALADEASRALDARQRMRAVAE